MSFGFGGYGRGVEKSKKKKTGNKSSVLDRLKTIKVLSSYKKHNNVRLLSDF